MTSLPKVAQDSSMETSRTKGSLCPRSIPTPRQAGHLAPVKMCHQLTLPAPLSQNKTAKKTVGSLEVVLQDTNTSLPLSQAHCTIKHSPSSATGSGDAHADEAKGPPEQGLTNKPMKRHLGHKQ